MPRFVTLPNEMELKSLNVDHIVSVNLHQGGLDIVDITGQTHAFPSDDDENSPYSYKSLRKLEKEICGGTLDLTKKENPTEDLVEYTVYSLEDNSHWKGSPSIWHFHFHAADNTAALKAALNVARSGGRYEGMTERTARGHWKLVDEEKTVSKFEFAYTEWQGFYLKPRRVRTR